MPRPWTYPFALVPVLVIAVAGVALVQYEPDSDGPYGEPSARETALLDERAREVVAAWDGRKERSGRTYVPVGEWTLRFGRDPRPGRDAEIERAVRQQRLDPGPERLPDSRPREHTVLWQDGESASVPVISAADAFKATASEECRQDGCEGPKVTGARLRSVPVPTAHGPATVPAWVFELDGTPVSVARIAVQPELEPKVVEPRFQRAGYAPVTDGAARGSTSMDVRFIGGPPGTGPCSSEHRLRVVEGRTAVVVIVQWRPKRRPDHDVHCGPAHTERRGTVRLSRPLGERVLLNLREGLPAPVTRS